jgi:IS5 family transposase
MIDASHIKVHPHAAGARGGNQDVSCTKGGLNTKLHLVVDAHGMPLRVLITQGATADCTQTLPLMESIEAEYLLADRGDDSDTIVEQANRQGMVAVIRPRENRKILREYDKDL